jgi:hypothetical protein
LESLRTVFKDSLMDSGKRNVRHKEWLNVFVGTIFCFM